jgi:DNA topoisomerase I
MSDLLELDVDEDDGPEAPIALPPELRYVDDRQPGIKRKKLRGKWAYFLPDGARIKDPAEIARINKLAVPPAYRHVWICPDPRGHIQATGRDARGRKQYRYHALWRALRDATKYERMFAFSRALPKVRARVDADLQRTDLGRERVLATVASLLDQTLVRVGNREYARDNQSYGLTTLEAGHVRVRGETLRFRFRGKSGVEHDVTVRHKKVASTVRRCLDLPGQTLFRYLDGDGTSHAVTSCDLNRYLREVSGGDFTAKDYRTWAGSALALSLLRSLDFEPERTAKAHVVAAVKEVASQLRNTPAVCRGSYIHPQVLERFTRGELRDLPPARPRKWLTEREVALTQFLERLEAGAIVADDPVPDAVAAK